MTIEESKELYLNRKFRSSKVYVPFVPMQIVPQDETTLAMTKIAEPSKTFNGMSVADMRILNEVKYSDDLHRPDILNKTYERAKRLSRYGKQVGALEFAKNYM